MPHLLLVEDHPNLMDQLSMALMLAGYETQTKAENGQIAVGLVQRNPALFDVVIMDIEMPLLDGRSAARAMRDLGYAHPIYAYSSLGGPAHQAASLQAGMDAHFVKALELNELLNQLNEYFGFKHGV